MKSVKDRHLTNFLRRPVRGPIRASKRKNPGIKSLRGLKSRSDFVRRARTVERNSGRRTSRSRSRASIRRTQNAGAKHQELALRRRAGATAPPAMKMSLARSLEAELGTGAPRTSQASSLDSSGGPGSSRGLTSEVMQTVVLTADLLQGSAKSRAGVLVRSLQQASSLALRPPDRCTLGPAARRTRKRMRNGKGQPRGNGTGTLARVAAENLRPFERVADAVDMRCLLSWDIGPAENVCL